MDIKQFKKAIWEVRKKYSRPYLTKKQLAEAYQLYEQADENVDKFKKLLAGVFEKI